MKRAKKRDRHCSAVQQSYQVVPSFSSSSYLLGRKEEERRKHVVCKTIQVSSSHPTRPFSSGILGRDSRGKRQETRDKTQKRLQIGGQAGKRASGQAGKSMRGIRRGRRRGTHGLLNMPLLCHLYASLLPCLLTSLPDCLTLVQLKNARHRLSTP